MNTFEFIENLVEKYSLSYELPENVEKYELIDIFNEFIPVFVKQNPYLLLAYTMYTCRIDPERIDEVREAFNEFVKFVKNGHENETNNDVINDLEETIEDFYDCGHDGRVFRDTNWNYEKIGNTFVKEMWEDLKQLLNFASEEDIFSSENIPYVYDV